MTIMHKLGRLIHPEAVTAAWYAQDCPPHLDTRTFSRWTLLRWRLACWLRGRETYHNWRGMR